MKKSDSTEALTKQFWLWVFGQNILGMRKNVEDYHELRMHYLNLSERWLEAEKSLICSWIKDVLKVEDITASNFMEKLDNGVIVCKLARLIQQKAEECRRKGIITEAVPSVRFKCWEQAKSASFYARDNADNFIRWCRKFGVHEAVIFESDGLVLHTQPRTVVLCLLELGRIASKYQMEAPGLIQLEKEIDEEQNCSSDGLGSLSSAGSLSPTPPMVRSRTESALSRASPPASPDSGIVATPPHLFPHNMRPRNRLSYHPPSEKEAKKMAVTPLRPSELDKKVMKIANTVCKDKKTEITRISEGKYCIGGKNVFVRLLNGRHVMVRVGGGWTTLEHFLSRHEPCAVVVLNGTAPPTDHAYLALDPASPLPGHYLHLKVPQHRPHAHAHSRSEPSTPAGGRPGLKAL